MSVRGFTLVEVVVVLAVLGIAAAAAVPAFRRLDEPDPATASSRAVQSLLRGARRLAVEQGVNVTVILEPATGRYWIDSGPADSLRRGTLGLAPGVELVGTAPRARFSFAPGGTAYGDLLMLRAPAASIPVRVETWSGDVRVDVR